MQGPDCRGWLRPGDPHEKSQPPFSFQIPCKRTQGPRVSVLHAGKNSISSNPPFHLFFFFCIQACCLALTMLSHSLPLVFLPCPPLLSFSLQQQNTVESLGPSLHYFKKPIIRHQSIYVIRKSLPLQSRLSSLHTVITGTKSIFNHFTDWAHQLSRNIVSCLLCESNIWAKTITLLCSRAALKMPCCHFPMSWTLSFCLCLSPDTVFSLHCLYSPFLILSLLLFSPSFPFTLCP